MEENTKSGGGNKGMMLIIVGMLGLIIVALAGVAVFLIMNMPSGEAGGEGYYHAGEPEEPEIPYVEDQILFDMSGPITASLQAPVAGRTSLAMVNMSIGINNLDPEEANELMQIIAEREMIVVSVVNAVLREYTAEMIDAPGGREMLNNDILEALQLMFRSTLIVAIYAVVNVHNL